jgi:hypothetical protein
LTTGERRQVKADEAEPSRDIYSVAVILWEMISRKIAWKGSSMVDIYMAVSLRGERPPVPATEIRDDDSETAATVWTRDRSVIEAFRIAEESMGKERFVKLIHLMQQCWEGDSQMRPTANDLVYSLQELDLIPTPVIETRKDVTLEFHF